VSAITVFFDVDFTLISPGSKFDGEGYRRFGVRHGLKIDASVFTEAVASAAVELDTKWPELYQAEIFIRYAKCLLENMGGVGPSLDTCAREIYDEWAVCSNFLLYDDVRPTFEHLCTEDVQIGLISNTHRCLQTFQSYFKLERYIVAALSSSEHGYMKPHPSIFKAALKLVDAIPTESVMVGDSMNHDIRGAQQVGMQGVLLDRTENGVTNNDGQVPVIQTLAQLPAVLLAL
jgi:HAD superfamily hydrolase (TIGR01509 family)